MSTTNISKAKSEANIRVQDEAKYDLISTGNSNARSFDRKIILTLLTMVCA